MSLFPESSSLASLKLKDVDDLIDKMKRTVLAEAPEVKEDLLFSKQTDDDIVAIKNKMYLSMMVLTNAYDDSVMVTSDALVEKTMPWMSPFSHRVKDEQLNIIAFSKGEEVSSQYVGLRSLVSMSGIVPMVVYTPMLLPILCRPASFTIDGIESCTIPTKITALRLASHYVRIIVDKVNDEEKSRQFIDNIIHESQAQYFTAFENFAKDNAAYKQVHERIAEFEALATGKEKLDSFLAFFPVVETLYYEVLCKFACKLTFDILRGFERLIFSLFKIPATYWHLLNTAQGVPDVDDMPVGLRNEYTIASAAWRDCIHFLVKTNGIVIHKNMAKFMGPTIGLSFELYKLVYKKTYMPDFHKFADSFITNYV